MALTLLIFHTMDRKKSFVIDCPLKSSTCRPIPTALVRDCIWRKPSSGCSLTQRRPRCISNQCCRLFI